MILKPKIVVGRIEDVLYSVLGERKQWRAVQDKDDKRFGRRPECVEVIYFFDEIGGKTHKILQRSCSRRYKSLNLNYLQVSDSSRNRQYPIVYPPF